MRTKLLITGVAGFIGFHLSKKLGDEKWDVIGVDNLNDYYDVKLKYNRLDILYKNKNFEFHKLDLVNSESIKNLFEKTKPDFVINLAAQAGVRYSLENPQAYIDSNIRGFFNILECCRHHPVQHLIYASSSSVYGLNKKIPFSEDDNVDNPISLYAATKKSNELMAYTYSKLYSIPTTGLRFFTVYGPWGRPDMAYYLFTKSIFENRPIHVFNYGDMQRDFTYIDDIIEGILKLISKTPEPELKNDKSWAPYNLFNIGNNKPVNLLDFIQILENLIGRKSIREMLPIQPGDVQTTFADISRLEKYIGFKPNTTIVTGLEKFVKWYKEYYHVVS